MKSLAKNSLIIFLGSLLLFSLMQCATTVVPSTVYSDNDVLADDHEISIGKWVKEWFKTTLSPLSQWG